MLDYTKRAWKLHATCPRTNYSGTANDFSINLFLSTQPPNPHMSACVCEGGKLVWVCLLLSCVVFIRGRKAWEYLGGMPGGVICVHGGFTPQWVRGWGEGWFPVSNTSWKKWLVRGPRDVTADFRYFTNHFFLVFLFWVSVEILDIFFKPRFAELFVLGSMLLMLGKSSRFPQVYITQVIVIVSFRELVIPLKPFHRCRLRTEWVQTTKVYDRFLRVFECLQKNIHISLLASLHP